jgi:hyperosmotically inducible periplasmic protein
MVRRNRPTAADRLAIPAAVAAGGVALGVVLEYFLDPTVGRRRRRGARDRALARVRRGERRAVRRARRAESHAVGIARRTLNARHRRREPVDDITLAHKVESELYRRTGVPKAGISVNAEDGVVFLRGVVDREEDIARIEAGTRRIAGVRDVENLLHTRGAATPASRPKLEREASDRR